MNAEPYVHMRRLENGMFEPVLDKQEPPPQQDMIDTQPAEGLRVYESSASRVFSDRHDTGMVKVWHHQLCHQLSSHPNGDEVYFVSGTTIQLLNTKTQATREVMRVDYQVQSMSVGCGYLAVCGCHGQLTIRSLETGQDVYNDITSLHSDLNNALHLAYLYDHPCIIISSNDKTVKIMSLSTLQILGTLPFSVCMNFATASPDGTHLVAAGDCNRCFLYKIERGNAAEGAPGSLGFTKLDELEVSKDLEGCCFSAAWDHTSKYFAVLQQTPGTVTVFDLETRTPIRRLHSVKRKRECRAVRFYHPPNSDYNLLIFSERTRYVHVVEFSGRTTLGRHQLLKLPQVKPLRNNWNYNYGNYIAGFAMTPNFDRLYIGRIDGIFQFEKAQVPSLKMACTQFIQHNITHWDTQYWDTVLPQELIEDIMVPLQDQARVLGEDGNADGSRRDSDSESEEENDGMAWTFANFLHTLGINIDMNGVLTLPVNGINAAAAIQALLHHPAVQFDWDAIAGEHADLWEDEGDVDDHPHIDDDMIALAEAEEDREDQDPDHGDPLTSEEDARRNDMELFSTSPTSASGQSMPSSLSSSPSQASYMSDTEDTDSEAPYWMQPYNVWARRADEEDLNEANNRMD